MATNKNFDRICLIAIIAAVVLTLLFMNGESLGITKIVDADSENHEDSQYFTEKDLDGSWDSSSATVITLRETRAGISGNGAYMQDGTLVIVSPGDYVVSGELTDGGIIVSSEKNAKVRILLNGVHLTHSHDACIRVEEADKVFLTLAEGSDNTLISGETFSDTALEDGTGGVIFAHDDLTINGSGNLDINGGYKHGIDANDSLVLAGGSIQITAPRDGVHVNNHLNICETLLTIDAQDDGMHADDSIYIESGTVTIKNSCEGIEANVVEIAGGEIDITCIDDGINASGGNTSAHPAGNFGNRDFSGRDFADRNFDDKAFSDKNFEERTFTEGEFEGKDFGKRGFMDGAIPQDGSMPENMQPPEEAGDTSVTEELPLVSVTGGKITITNTQGNDADGIDSNGDLLISGGEVYINLIGNGSNCALDYGSESGGICQINGGIVVAAGGSSMLEALDSSSAQASFTWISRDGIVPSGILTLTDADGNQIISHSITADFTAVTISCPALFVGSSYTLSVGDHTEEITLTDTATSSGRSASPGDFGHTNSRHGDFRPGDFGSGDFSPDNTDSGDFQPGNVGPDNFRSGDFDPNNLPQPDTGNTL